MELFKRALIYKVDFIFFFYVLVGLHDTLLCMKYFLPLQAALGVVIWAMERRGKN